MSPVTPFIDGSTELNPYQFAIIRVTDSKTGKELTKTDNVVVPVSNEMNYNNCHGEKYKVNTAKLYRNSYLINNSNTEMNGLILCESCHNGTHAEWESANVKDNLLPMKLLGYSNFIDKCMVCHEAAF